MTEYAIFDGGNVLQHYDSFVSGVAGYDNIRPTNHQPNRSRTLLKHINTGGLPFTADWNPLVVESGDVLLTHLIGAGWVIRGVGVHVRQAGKGKLNISVISGEGEEFKPTALAPTEAQVDLTKKGFSFYSYADLNAQGVGHVKVQYVGEAEGEEGEIPPLQGCFGVLLELIYLEDDGECNCITTPCPTEFPSPECSPTI